ncbi:hypothetical protein P12x_002152 [Tundrisphaera lichenicola]|uniref:hypothetical protein n=1 Tax=Tundrisphaera lichenicola TaxID=2029860 RepID=UPI003EB99C46
MTEASIVKFSTELLKIFANRPDGRLSATELKKKLAATSYGGQGDGIVSGLIEEGMIAVTGGGSSADHPRPKASYRLTSSGKDRAKDLARPARPDHEDEQLKYQESYILLQIFRSDDATLSRSKLNEKLKSVAARTSLEFEPRENPGTIDYHLHTLVENGHLDQKRQGVGINYTLTEEGRRALAATRQHEGASFTLKGDFLNRLLEAARGTASPVEEIEPSTDLSQAVEETPTRIEPQMNPEIILGLVDRLKAGAYAGKDVIPIHALRHLVAEGHGSDAASHQVFDHLLRQMRGNDQIELIAISDNRDATQEQLDDSIPGMNETILAHDGFRGGDPQGPLSGYNRSPRSGDLSAPLIPTSPPRGVARWSTSRISSTTPSASTPSGACGGLTA